MKIECPECHKAYKIPDEKIPFGKKFSVSCLACKKRIVIDLISEEKPNESIQPPKLEKEPQAVEPAPEPSFGKKQPSGIKLKG